MENDRTLLVVVVPVGFPVLSSVSSAVGTTLMIATPSLLVSGSLTRVDGIPVWASSILILTGNEDARYAPLYLASISMFRDSPVLT